MTNQEIFDVLAENESKLCYAHWHNPNDEGIEIAYKAAREALISFVNATGCHN